MPKEKSRAREEPETIVDLVDNGELDRFGDIFYTNAARGGGIVKVARSGADWARITRDDLRLAEANPKDADEARRWCILFEDIPECDHDTAVILYLDHETGDTILGAIDGPEHDHGVAVRIIARDVNATPRTHAPVKFALTHVPPEPANDNKPSAARQDDRLERLERLALQYGGQVIQDRKTGDAAVYGATTNGKACTIRIGVDGVVRLTSGKEVFVVEETKRLQATPFALRDPKEIPQREWLFARHYMRRFLTVTVGAGGGGKSAHAVSEALAMVTGRPLLDASGPLMKPLRVWYVNAEDPSEEIERRFGGAAKHFRISGDDIADRLFTDSGRDQEFVIVRQERRDFTVCEPMIEDVLEAIRDNKIDVLIVDPFVSTHEVPENDNGLIQRVAKQWRRVADQGNCSVELIHHVTKGNVEVTADSARGGGALKDAARSVRTINAMTKDEAEKAGVGDHRRFFRVDLGKFNMIAASTSQWRRFASVPLGNGRGLLKAGDEIGVVEEWRWPSTDVAVADITEEQLAAIKRKIGGCDCRDSDQSHAWAGHKVAEALQLDMSDGAEKRRVKRMLAAWKKDGHFRIEMRRDQKGADRPCLVPVFPTSE